MKFEMITRKIDDSNPLEFGTSFSKSFELFKKVWVQGFIVLLLTTVCILPFYILAYLPLIAAGITDPEMLQHEELSPPIIIGLIVSIPIVMIAVMTISLGFMAAFLRICKIKDLNENSSDDYFFYFKNGRLRKLVILASIYLGLTVLGMLACGVGLIYLVVPLSLIPAFLAFHDELSPMEIVKASFQLGNKNWLVIFGLLLVMGFLAELGIILCIVGIFFTAMLSKVPVYYMYKDGIGFSAEEGLEPA